MNRSLVSAVLRRCAPVVFGVCLVLVVAGSGLAANTYTDLKGRFAFDLPEGWKMNSSTADRLFIFKGGSGETMILMYDEEAKDVDKLVEAAAQMFKDSGVPNAVLEGTVKKLTVNKSPARWAIYAGTVDAGTVKVKMFGVVGAVAMKDGGGLFMVNILNDSGRSKWEKQL
ncbi:MAG: hypothetical protein AABZ10_12460, partial [Nitrospirota bacterium]